MSTAGTKADNAPVGKEYSDAGIAEALVQSYGEVGKNPPSGRIAGIVLHPTSLDGPYGTGDLGATCFEFVDWLALAGMKAWQVLPLVPPDDVYFSPYSGQDALCGNPLLISLEWLVEDGLLNKGDLPKAVQNEGEADFPAALKLKTPLVRAAAERLLDDSACANLREALAKFRRAEAWVEESALFDCLRRDSKREGKAWWEWEAEVRDRDSKALERLRAEHTRDIDVFVAMQLLFDMQWGRVKEYANSKGVDIIGDMPIYVGGQSADVWANRELFELGPDGAPLQVSGVPPDAFSDTGQLWGSPLYAWPAHHEEDYKWWSQRIGRAGQVYNQTRIDHFRAFAGYWAVDADRDTAMVGTWRKGPGKPLFDRVAARLGAAAPSIMAEDLGVITEDVTALRKAIGAPGMVVLQFAWGGGYDNTHLPHNHYANSFVYPGTHDNETTVGWYKDSATAAEKRYIEAYLKASGEDDISWAFIHEAMRSVSGTCMVMMQDVLSLDNSSRINSPGKAEGNWGWRLPGGWQWQRASGIASRLRGLATLFDRCAAPAAAPSGAQAAGASTVDDPLEAYCAQVPDADECRVYED